MKCHSFMTLAVLAAVSALVATVPAHALTWDEKKTKATFEKIDDYHACQREDRTGHICQKALEVWVESHPLDTFTAAKLTRSKMNAYTSITFFKQAFEQGPQDCTDSDLKLAITASFDALLPSTQQTYLKDAQELAFETCHQIMTQDLSKQMKKASAQFKKNVCDGVAKYKTTKKALPAEILTVCR